MHGMKWFAIACVTGALAASGGNVRDFGAVGDGKTDDTAAIQRAIDAGGAVRFPSGTYLTGSVYLKSDGGLDLEPGAVIKAHPDLSKWPRRDCLTIHQAMVRDDFSGLHLICAVGVTNVFIRGGTVDGNVLAFLTGETHPAVGNRIHRSVLLQKPCQMVWFCEAENVRVTDTAFRNASMWTLFLHGCESVFVRGVRIDSLGDIGEDDGIDIDCCSRVTVSDCIINVGDDGITLRGNTKGLTVPRPCEYVTVANCVVRSEYAHAIRVGVGSGAIRHCSFDNIVMNDTRGGIWVCNKYSAGRGVDISDVNFSNIRMEAVCGIFIRHDYKFVDPGEPFAGMMKDVRFSHVTGTSRLPLVKVPNGKATMENIRFDDCDLAFGTTEGADSGELKFFQFVRQ